MAGRAILKQTELREIHQTKLLDEILVLLPWKRFCQAIRRHVAGGYPGNVDPFVGNLFPQPMLANIHMFELGDECWQVLGE